MSYKKWALPRWLEEKGLSHEKLASLLGRSRGAVSQYCSGTTLPPMTIAYHLEILSGSEVTMRDIVEHYMEANSIAPPVKSPLADPPDPIAPPATPAPPSHTLDLFAQEPG